MKPPKMQRQDYEKVPTDDFLPGVIEEVQYDMKHVFKGFQGQPDKVKPGIRFKFKIEGLKFPHYSKWMAFNYGEKSTLYTKYLTALVDNAEPDMDFELDILKGIKVKTLWNDNNGFQNVETIRPVGGKVKYAPFPKDDLPVVDMGPEPDFSSPEFSGDPDVNQEPPF